MRNPIVSAAFKGASDAMLDTSNRDAIIRRQEGRCFYCRVALGSRVVFDHLLPRRLGGRHGPGNRVAACGPCDMRKGGRPPTAEEVARFQHVHPERAWRRVWIGEKA